MAAPKVIAVTAPSRRSGKGTITTVLCREYGYTELMFAMPLKVMFTALCMYQGISKEQYPRILDGDLKETPLPEVAGLSLRTFAEGVGTDWGRKMVHPEIWVSMAEAKVRQILRSGRSVVLSDVRFPNECAIAQAYGGEVWSVVRPESNGGLAPTLSSEGHLKDYSFDMVFTNDREVGHLEDEVRFYMNERIG